MQWASRPGASRFFGITNNQCCRIMLPLDFPCELLQVTKSAPWQHNSASSYAVAYGVFGSEKERKPRHTPRSFRPWRTFLNPSMPASCASQNRGGQHHPHQRKHCRHQTSFPSGHNPHPLQSPLTRTWRKLTLTVRLEENVRAVAFTDELVEALLHFGKGGRQCLKLSLSRALVPLTSASRQR